MSEVSVIIPLFNKENYIEGCIASVLKQSFSDFELIIIDDGSTDASAAKVASFNDSRISLIRQKNAGPGAARNVGLANARGAYITFIDADDQWEPEFLTTAVTRLKDNPICDLFLCGSTWQPQMDFRLPVLDNEPDAKSGIWKIPPDLTAQQGQKVMDFFALGTVLLKKEVPEKYRGFFDRVRCTSGEDAYLWIQVMLNHVIYRELRSLVNINTVGSDLGIGRGEVKPIPPSLLYSEQLFNNCPEPHRPFLSRLLNYIAFFAIRRELYKLKLRNAWKLYRKFPQLEEYRTPEFPTFPSAFWMIPLKKIRKKIFRLIDVKA